MASEIAQKLVDLQKADGYWLNTEATNGGERFFPAMVTSMAVLTLLAPALPADAEPELEVKIEPAGKDLADMNLHIYDPDERHLGMNNDTGVLDEEIPGATLVVNGNGGQRALLPELESGAYRIELTGMTPAAYSLRVNGSTADGSVTSRCMNSTFDPAQGFSTEVVVAAPFSIVSFYMHDLADETECEGEGEPVEGEGEPVEGEGEPSEGEGNFVYALLPYPADDLCYQEVIADDPIVVIPSGTRYASWIMTHAPQWWKVKAKVKERARVKEKKFTLWCQTLPV